jgi:hypothetical protein
MRQKSMIKTTRVGLLLLVIGQGLSACSGPGSQSIPSAPSPPPSSAPRPASAIKGLVTDSADRRIAGALVEVLDGAHAGMSTTSDGNGEFALAASFDDTTLFRASKDGHIGATRSWKRDVSDQSWLHFMLSVLAPPVSLAGDYTLTFVADGACAAALPADLRTRSYPASITAAPSNSIYPPSTRFTITPSGAEFEAPFDWFSVGVAGDYLAFWLGDERLIEELAGDTYLELIGSAIGVTTSGASSISASFDGAFNYCAKKSATDSFHGCSYSSAATVTINASCASKHHQLILTRR